MEEGGRVVEMEDDLKKKIKKTVKRILKRSSMYDMTEIKARDMASSELNLDLSEEPYKLLVRESVENFIEEAIAAIENQKGKSQDQRGGGGGHEKTATKKTKKKKKET